MNLWDRHILENMKKDFFLRKEKTFMTTHEC